VASPTDRVYVRANVIFRALGDESVILNLDSGVYFGLDEIGTRIWQLLEQRDVGGVCATLRSEYDVSAERVEADVTALIDRLSAKGLVECRAS
jgi:hypothetical protein